MLTVVAIGCTGNSDNSTATVSSVDGRPETSNNQSDMDPHPTELLAKLRSYDGDNNADAILAYLDIDLTNYEKVETGQAAVVEHKLNSVFFLRRSTDGATLQNGKPVWIYSTHK